MMDKVISFISFIPFYPGYFVLFMLCSGLYFMTLGPVLFKLWIIPSIERKSGVSIRVEEEHMLFPFANWGLPAMEIPLYIFYMYIGYRPWKKKQLEKFTLMHKLAETDYDINRATRAEKFIIFMSFIFLVGLLVSCIVFGIYLYNEKH